MTLKNLIEDSKLSREDKNLWFSILTKLDDVQIKIFEDFADGKEENLKLLTENLKSKVEAIKNLDEEAMEKIIQQEQNV